PGALANRRVELVREQGAAEEERLPDPEILAVLRRSHPREIHQWCGAEDGREPLDDLLPAGPAGRAQSLPVGVRGIGAERLARDPAREPFRKPDRVDDGRNLPPM